jgi:nicotinamide-nucleotide amidase
MTLKQEILKYSRQEKMKPLSPWFDSKFDALVNRGVYTDLPSLEDTGKQLVSGLIAYGKKYNIQSVALGMSGGVDSALTSALFKSAGWKVTGLTMPIHQNPDETTRGIEACRALGISHKHVDLTSTYDTLLASVKSHDYKITSESEALRRGNLRVRLRMMTVYNEASAIKGLVGSTDNFSELAAGFWTLHGDVGDLAPIQSLNKSWEVPKLAELYGVPVETVEAKPTDGLGISDGDEDQFGFSYLEFDIVLLTLCQIAMPQDRQAILDYLNPATEDIDKVSKILNRIKSSSFKRQNPYNLEHPLQTNRFIGLRNLDTSLWNNI